MSASCVLGRIVKGALPKSLLPMSPLPMGLLQWLMAVLLFAAAAAPATAQPPGRPPADQPIVVPLDQATLFKLPDRAATVVIGNPLIADVTVQPGGIAIVTGKGYGGTNVIVMDQGGIVLSEKPIVVTDPADHVVYVYRGPARTTYSCNPDCSARVNLGDDPEEFGKTLAETVTRSTQAMSAGGK